jgi:hypothetical protein
MPDPIILRTPDGNACTFWWDTEKNNHASEQAGRPIFDKVLKMEVFMPGNRDSKPHFVIERHMANGQVKQYSGETKGQSGQTQRGPWREIMADQLKAWESATGDGGKMNGTPLSEATFVDIAMAATLKASGVHTVEALAEVPDGLLAAIGHHGRALRDQAKNYLQTAAGNAPIVALTAELEEERAKTADLQRQINELAAKLETPAETPPQRGRPRKAA